MTAALEASDQFDARGIENFLGERGTLGSSRKNQCTEHGGEPEETDSFVVGKSCGKIPHSLRVNPTGLAVCRLARHVGGERSSGASVCRVVAMRHREIGIDQSFSGGVTLPTYSSSPAECSWASSLKAWVVASSMRASLDANCL